MKNLFFSLIAVVLTTVNANSQSTLNVNNVGEFHNIQMENYFKSLQKIVVQKGIEKITKEDFYVIFKNQTLQTFGENNSTLVSETNSNFSKYFDYDLQKNIDSSIELIKSSTYKNEQLKTFLINLITESKSIKTENISSFFDAKSNEAKTIFKDKDLEIALISINTGRSSFLYWEQNLDKWNSLFGLNNLSLRAAGPPKAIGAADVAGATVGAINGALGGTCVLPVVGTCTGALAGGCAGGMYASVGAAAASLFLSLFK